MIFNLKNDLFNVAGISSGEDEEVAAKKTSPGKRVRFAAEVTSSDTKPAPVRSGKTDDPVADRAAAHPLLTDLDDSDSVQKRRRKADQWFTKVRVWLID